MFSTLHQISYFSAPLALLMSNYPSPSSTSSCYTILKPFLYWVFASIRSHTLRLKENDFQAIGHNYQSPMTYLLRCSARLTCLGFLSSQWVSPILPKWDFLAARFNPSPRLVKFTQVPVNPGKCGFRIWIIQLIHHIDGAWNALSWSQLMDRA